MHALDDHAERSSSTDADHDGGRCRESESAGAGDDEHGDGAGERIGQRRALQQTDGERPGRDQQDDWDEHGRDAVDERLDRCTTSLGLCDEVDDLCEHGGGSDRGRLDDEAAGTVERATDHIITRHDVDGQRLAGEHRRVDRGTTFDDTRVDRDALTGTDEDAVAGDEFCDRDLAPVGERRGPRAEFEELRDGLRGAALGAMLEPTSEEDGRDDRGRGLEVDVREPGDTQAHPTVEFCGVEHDECPDGPQVGGECPDGYERVHRHLPVDEVHRGVAVELPTGPENDRRGEYECDPLPTVKHERWDHGDEECRDGQGDGEGELTLQAHATAFVHRCVVGHVRDGIADPFDSSTQRVRVDEVGVVGDGRPMGGEVDVRVGDTVELGECTADPGRA